jgi:hypothetical protein
MPLYCYLAPLYHYLSPWTTALVIVVFGAFPCGVLLWATWEERRNRDL